MTLQGASRVGLDTAGGLITGLLQSTVRANSFAWVIAGAAVASHGSSPHNNATMLPGSVTVKIGGIPIVRANTAATCGDVATGSTNVRVGS
jgi:uncharacterized Zn-binding protein involved in type VI secretion